MAASEPERSTPLRLSRALAQCVRFVCVCCVCTCICVYLARLHACCRACGRAYLWICMQHMRVCMQAVFPCVCARACKLVSPGCLGGYLCCVPVGRGPLWPHRPELCSRCSSCVPAALGASGCAASFAVQAALATASLANLLPAWCVHEVPPGVQHTSHAPFMRELAWHQGAGAQCPLIP